MPGLVCDIDLDILDITRHISDAADILNDIAQCHDPVSYTHLNHLKEDFNMTTTHFIMVDDSLSNSQMRDLSDQVEAVDGVNQVLSYEKFVGGGLPEDLIPQEIQDIFHAGGKRMLLANSSYKSGSDEQNKQLDEITAIVNQAAPNGVIRGEGAMTKDFIEVADVDFKNVNIASVLAVFLLICLLYTY